MKIRLAFVVLLAALGVHCGGEAKPALDPSTDPAGVTSSTDAGAPQTPPGELPKK
jgi:hypothetical protein